MPFTPAAIERQPIARDEANGRMQIFSDRVHVCCLCATLRCFLNVRCNLINFACQNLVKINVSPAFMVHDIWNVKQERLKWSSKQILDFLSEANRRDRK
jgi:hypothetical protein